MIVELLTRRSELASSMLILTTYLRLTTLHPLIGIWCKSFWVETPSQIHLLTSWAELSKLLVL